VDGALRVLTASDDHTARLWDAHGKELAVFKGHTNSLRGCALTVVDGALRVLTASHDNTARLWDAHEDLNNQNSGDATLKNNVKMIPKLSTLFKHNQASLGEVRSSALHWNSSADDAPLKIQGDWENTLAVLCEDDAAGDAGGVSGVAWWPANRLNTLPSDEVLAFFHQQGLAF
jgi:WD40 repeat protein